MRSSTCQRIEPGAPKGQPHLYLGVVLTVRPAQERYFVTTPDTPPLTSAATCPSANGVARPPGEAR